MMTRDGHWRRFRDILLAMSAAGVALALAALGYLRWSGTVMPWQGEAAVAAGVLMTMVVAGALMGLVFLSARSGHDASIDRDDRD